MKISLLVLALLFAHAASSDLATDKAEALADWNLGFGIGVEAYQDTYIESATLQGSGRIVTTDQSFDMRPSAWLTTNWPVFKGGKWGLYAGVKVIDSNSDMFSAFSIGPQYSFVLDSLNKVSIGVGWVTHDTKTFAEGIVAGQSLPSQYDDVTYEKGTEHSWMIMMSIGLN